MLDVKQIKAIGFDVDGTLYRYSPEVSIALSQRVIEVAAAELHRSTDEFGEAYLVAREKYASNTLALNSLGLDGQQIFQKILDQFPLEQHLQPDKKLAKVIHKLGKRYRLFIITNGSGKQVERKLAAIGLDYHDFDPRIYCYDLGWAKPEPAPFLCAIESLKLEPSEIVYVGDRVEIDIEGARAVGMRTILIGGKSDLADACVESVYDIVSVL